jgi:aminopeptidase N
VSRRALLRALGGTAVAAGADGCASGTGDAGVPAAAAEAAATSLDPYFPGRGAGNFLVNRYTFDLAYAEDTGRIEGTVSIRVLPFSALSGLSLDLVSTMNVAAVRVNGTRARFSQENDKLHVIPSASMPTGRMAVLEIAYGGRPAPITVAGVGAVGWQETRTGSGAGVMSLPIGAPTWFPCADHPTLKAAYEISVTVPSHLSVLASGRLVGKVTHGPGTRWTFQHDGPMATYLVTLQIGDFVVRTSTGPGGVQIRNAYPEAIAAPAEVDLGRQSRMMTVFAELFGPFPFDVYGTAIADGDHAFGAQTLGLVGSALVDGRRTNEHLVARALAAQWFGGTVSLASWRDIWLSSGFARYAEWLWSEKSGGASADDYARAAMGQLSGLKQDLVLSDPGPQRILDERVALRGASFLHALRLTMGDQIFFQLLRLWVDRNHGGSAQTADFASLVPQVHPAQELKDFTRYWAYSAALPEMPG